MLTDDEDIKKLRQTQCDKLILIDDKKQLHQAAVN
jgi:hypothetical protein